MSNYDLMNYSKEKKTDFEKKLIGKKFDDKELSAAVGGIDPSKKCPVCGKMLYPNEYTNHLMTKHPGL